MSQKKKSTAAATGKKVGRGIFQGHILSLDFFKRNAVYIIAVVLMALAYIANKYVCQSSMQEVMKLKQELANSETNLVKASSDYNSMIRESEMTKLMRQKRINLKAPEEPPYHLSDGKK